MYTLEFLDYQKSKNNIADKEITMFEVTEKASEMLNEFLKDKDETHKIRVMMMEGG
jgi:flagellar biosynthesis protein FliP